MNTWIWLTACLIYWWFGRNITDIALLLKENKGQTLIYPPRVFFYICGAPAAKVMPRGVMASKGFGMQIGAIVLALAGPVLNGLRRMDGWAFVVCFVPAFLVGLLVSEFSRRIWPYSPNSTLPTS